MADKTLNSLVGGYGGMATIPASSIKGKTGSGNKPLVKVVNNITVNATGAGITYTVTDKCALITMILSDLTANDTIFTLTELGTGKIISEYLTVTSSSVIPIVNTYAVVTNTSASAGEFICISPLEFSQGFSLFVKTIADNSISVAFSYLELS